MKLVRGMNIQFIHALNLFSEFCRTTFPFELRLRFSLEARSQLRTSIRHAMTNSQLLEV